jgi:DNA-binding CsgD family transcriptional regulator/tetratricopeptide (TPR) repeat protein
MTLLAAPDDVAVSECLLERGAELHALQAAVGEAAAGRGGVVLVSGEAGIGKTSLVRAFLKAVPHSARLLVGACDDLVTPRTFGPLRDAVALSGGPLADELTGEPDGESVYAALLKELSHPAHTTVLVVEDVHWADDATLDALRYVVRRVERLSALVVLTYRDDEIDAEHPLRRLLGGLTGVRVRRLGLRPLSRDAVAELGAGAPLGASALHAITRGNPFFVTEALAAPADAVPETVVDAVMARVRQLPRQTRAALQQLAVVPSNVQPWLVDALLGGPGPIAEAEQRGIVEIRPEGLAFRHELARRAVELTLPVARRIEMNRAVVDALLARDDADLSRIVHHAVAAGDVDTILARGPAAAREAAAAGSHRQALAHYEHVAAYLDALPDDAKAQILAEYSWQLYAAQRWSEAVAVAGQAAALWERLGDAVALGETLVTLSRSAYMADRPGEAMRSVERAEQVLARTGNAEALGHAQSSRASLLALTDRQEAALVILPAARDLAERVGRTDLVAHSLNYLGVARVDLGDPGGIDDLRASLGLSLSIPHHEYAARAYTNLGEALYQLRAYGALEALIAEGLPYVEERDLPGHAYNLSAHRGLLLLARGEWDKAEAVFRELVAANPDPGQLTRLIWPALGRLLARRGDPAAGDVLSRAWRLAQRSNTLLALVPAGIACVEHAWLSGDVGAAQEQVAVLLKRTATRAGARGRGELLRYLSRAGCAVERCDGCPPEWSVGLAGDWRGAAALWGRIGDPYERALELAASGEVAPTLEALETLDRLGAAPAAQLVRRRLRDLGVVHVPRGPRQATRANPSGLTDRQLDVLALLADGLTNAEIAERLVLSVRTVDHHVSAILTKLGVTSRRQAARLAAHPAARDPG